jgi:hypothetical protein
MEWFCRRAWYLASIVIGLTAVAVDLQAKSIIGAEVGRIARVPDARHDGALPEVISALKQTGQSLVDRGSSVGFVGMLWGWAQWRAFSFRASAANGDIASFRSRSGLCIFLSR